MSEIQEHSAENQTALPIEAEMSEQEARAEVEKSVEETGCREKVASEVVDRLVGLARYSRYFFDSVMISHATSNILDYIAARYSSNRPEAKLTDEQKGRGRLAALLHDAGKSGPGNARPEVQEAVLALFRIETRKDSQTGQLFGNRLVGEVVGEYYPARKEEFLAALESCGVAAADPMSKFWNKHAYWTKEILEAHPGELSLETRVIAASHHIDKGHDPYGIKGVAGKGTIRMQAQTIGAMEEYVQSLGGGYAEALEQRVLLAADKYEAAVRRSESDHEGAFKSLKAEVGDAYAEDDLMDMVFAAIDELGKKGEIFR